LRRGDPMTGCHRRVFKSAFRVERLLAQIQADAGGGCADLEAARQPFDAAWQAGDALTLIRMGRALRDAGALRAKMALRLATALLNVGLPEEAGHTLRQHPAGGELQAIWQVRCAQASLASGSPLPPTGLPTPSPGELDEGSLATLGLLGALVRPPASSKTWTDSQAWFDGCLDARLAVHAARIFREVAGSLSPKGAKQSIADIAETAFCILRLGDAAAAVDVLEGLRPAFEAYDQVGLLDGALARLRGRPFDIPPQEQPRRYALSLLDACVAEAMAAAKDWSAAVAGFGRIGADGGMLNEVWCEMARCVGREVLASHPLALTESHAPKVFDVFPFNGEFLMLEMKLAEMGSWVDGFVLVEAAETFTGKPKPLYFAENSNSAGDRSKITHVVVDRFPEAFQSPWAREFYQRDMAIRGLAGRCAASDVVIISDVDEIVRRDAVQAMTDVVTGADLRLFNYYLNCENKVRSPMSTVFARAAMAASFGLSYLRLGHRRYETHTRVTEAGWHFSSIGGVADLRRKFESFSHTEFADLDEEAIRRRLEDVAGAGVMAEQYAVREIDEEMPRFVRENRERLAEFLL
jgi:beta-1,4-mannosyl-glycoprotein beta-1,4-N-acetylglucosaminyltransferase